MIFTSVGTVLELKSPKIGFCLESLKKNRNQKLILLLFHIVQIYGSLCHINKFMASKNEWSIGRNINSSNEYSKYSYIKWGLEEPRRKHLDNPDHAVSNNKNNNQLNGIITTELKFYYIYNIDNLVNIYPTSGSSWH